MIKLYVNSILAIVLTLIVKTPWVLMKARVICLGAGTIAQSSTSVGFLRPPLANISRTFLTLTCMFPARPHTHTAIGGHRTGVVREKVPAGPGQPAVPCPAVPSPALRAFRGWNTKRLRSTSLLVVVASWLAPLHTPAGAWG